MLDPVKQQTAETLKQASHAAIGAVGTVASWGLSEIAAGTSVFVGISTGLYMLSMFWLNIKKGKRIDRTTLDEKGDTRPPKPPNPKPPESL